MKRDDACLVRFSGFRHQVERLSACHAAKAGSARERANKLYAGGGVEFRFIGCDNVEGVGQQAITGQNGGCLIKGLVHGWLAPAQIVIIHGWQIVMDQRIAMDTFQRGSDAQHRLAVLSEKGSTFEDEKTGAGACRRSVRHGAWRR